jgi:hypothetical protein
MTDFDDREKAEAMAESLSADESEAMQGLARTMTVRGTVPALRVNCATGESVSLSGTLSESVDAHVEDARREQLLQYRRR